MIKKKNSVVLKTYKEIFSPDTGVFRFLYTQRTPVCVFYPSCSEYFCEVFEKKGFIVAIIKGTIRLFRCHPWQKNNIDLP